LRLKREEETGRPDMVGMGTKAGTDGRGCPQPLRTWE
jgi:hypothetical protein